MEVVPGIATERHQVRFDDTRAATRADCTVWGARPGGFSVVGCPDGQRVDAVRRHLHAGVAGSQVHLAVVANGHGHQGVAIAQQVVDDRRPGVYVGVFNRQVRAEAEVDELVLP